MTTASSKLTILVDDSDEMTGLLAQALSDHGFEVIVLNDLEGAHALGGAQGVVISDTRIPAVTLRKLAELAPSRPSIVLVSCALDVPEPEGVFFLRKPFELQDLFELVERVLGTGNLQDASGKLQDPEDFGPTRVST